ncbi:MAG: hypothetical protein ACI8YQ_004359 [Polaribacter sp.]|jgi:uncharacterized protein YggE
MKKYFTIILLTLFSLNSYCQIGGNQLYQNNSGNNNHAFRAVKKSNIISTASTLTISASVLLNKKADYYLVTIGVKEEAKTVVECGQNLNNRIKDFVSDLMKVGIRKEGIYEDFVSQTKIYDHKVDGNKIIEYFEGFEIRKNLIIKVKDLDLIDKVTELASKQEIYDIVKVDYFNDDVEEIYNQLFDEVIKIIEKKKLKFSKHSSVPISNKYRIIRDDFSVYNPKDLYKQYNEAFETSVVNTQYSSNYIKKEVRKDRTFYYEGVQNSLGLDKVIDEISPVVGIQYTLGLSITYEL